MVWIALDLGSARLFARLARFSELTALAEMEIPLSHINVKPLTGELKSFYHLRIGHYRVTFAFLKKMNTIAVVNIAPRGDIYS